MSDFKRLDDETKRADDFEQLHDYREEAAAEVIPLEQNRKSEGEIPTEEDRTVVKNNSVGIFALVLSILSLLIMPIILGAAGIITGIYAKRRDSRTLGNWAIVIGAISVVTSLLFSPYL